MYPDCHQMLTYDVGDATETVADHRQQAAVAAATGLADVYGAAVRGGLLPMVRGTRGKHEIFEIRGIRSPAGRQNEMDRKFIKYQAKWDSDEGARLVHARKGRTRDNASANTVRPWRPRYALDAFPGGGELEDVPAFVAEGPAPQPARDRTVAAAKAKVKAGAAAHGAWPKDSRGRFTMGP
ncbi:MAG: hypothetical protein GY772_13750, partial [bacterium]|nr:hypothetical protein [bacterium]